MKYLLDVNTLLAAIWVTHPDHKKTDAWILGKTLVTCPLSELGFLRVSTHPKALKSNMKVSRQLLDSFVVKQNIEFVPANLPALKSNAQKSEQVTDFYLAELALSMGMRLATLDRNINHSAIEVIV
jgi:predicted nucleic acid-binding protein